MKILVACEESQAVTIELRRLGHEAYSCDLQECSGGHPEWHIKGDVLPLLNGDCEFNTMGGERHSIAGRWDMIIAFPPCTKTSNAGARHLWKGRKLKATPHKCNDTHWRIAILWKAIGLPRTFARKSALTQAARQSLSARIRFANANMMLNLAPCFSIPRYRVFRKRSCFLTTPNTCSTFARTEDFACSAFFAAY